MSGATDISEARRDLSPEEIAAALRAEWRMIAAVSVRAHHGGEGLEAEIHLDPIVVKGALEQQGYPRTTNAMARAEGRRLDAIAECVEALNEKLPTAKTIRSFRVGDHRRSW